MDYFRKSEITEQLNSYLSKKYGMGKYSVRAYQNLWLNLYDICASLQIHFTHKNQIGLVRNGFFLSEQLNKIWLKQLVPIQYKLPTQSWIEYIHALKAETNFVLWSSENEVTGEVLVSEHECNEIHEELSKKKIFSIQITHKLNMQMLSHPFAILIVRESFFKDGASVVCHTDKFRAAQILIDYQNLPEKKLFDNLIEMAQQVRVTKESSYSYAYFNKFSFFQGHLADRYVFHFPDANATAVKENLSFSGEYFCPAELPFWTLDLFKNWWPEAENESFLRGLMVTQNDAINKDTDFFNKISNSYGDIRRLGN